MYSESNAYALEDLTLRAGNLSRRVINNIGLMGFDEKSDEKSRGKHDEMRDGKNDEFVHFDGKKEELEQLDENRVEEDCSIKEIESNRVADITGGWMGVEVDEVKGIQSKNRKDNVYVLCRNRGMSKVAWKPLVKIQINGRIVGENSAGADCVVLGINKSVLSESINDRNNGNVSTYGFGVHIFAKSILSCDNKLFQKWNWEDLEKMIILLTHVGTIDPPLFIRRFHDDILIVQVYVDDIIFGSTHPRYIQLFFDLMKSRFEMSMMGEMTSFLGLQVNQSPCSIFINQSKYVSEILKKYGIESCDPVDQNGTPVDATKYRSMIGALMYLTSSRPDIIHATCLCARYQAKPTEKHLKEVKRIFRYLQGTVNMGLWYSKDSGFELTVFSDADYAGCKDTFEYFRWSSFLR
nr:uncharacterized mitochondrial protein AtMg00810-like [Tanacetum cinerariifolium]